MEQLPTTRAKALDRLFRNLRGDLRAVKQVEETRDAADDADGDCDYAYELGAEFGRFELASEILECLGDFH